MPPPTSQVAVNMQVWIDSYTNQFKWTFVPDVVKYPPGVSEILYRREGDRHEFSDLDF